MGRIDEKYRYNITPIARETSIIKGEKYRFTVLTEGLIRIEYSEEGIFEDRATQTVINREFSEVDFNVKEDAEKVVIDTNQIKLTYYKNEKFNQGSIYAIHKDSLTREITYWRYGQSEGLRNLGGTVRTLDLVDGEIPLEDGLLSRSGFATIDDSKSVIIAEDGWIDERYHENVDLYLFCYKNNYYGALSAFYKLTGSTPLLPRYALGNMWSRYYPYSQQEYIDLMDRFEREGYPFSVSVIDMDWHKYITHWTGYTWNEELFPDYKKFLLELHKRNLEPTLNLHPADGVQPEESMYAEFAEAMGAVDGEPIHFDISNPLFLENYFKLLHNPYEKDGVTFWWIDWQQGNTTRIKNLDPLWMLNHYHTLDVMRNGNRGLILSRYAGFGSHRYPLGFSGDTVISWDSLDFQPYFTVTASNVGYSWWSHDIGGHMRGTRDDELVARWVQFGVFSPISRLHSYGVLMSKEPWNYNEIAERSMKNFLRLRHELVPYLYTMNYRTYKQHQPLIAPLYYKHPLCETAYAAEYRNEYYFGSEMLVMPITTPSDTATGMGHAEMYIPEGVWFDFFNGIKYIGGNSITMYRNLYEMPVLVKAGGIIPMSGDVSNDVSNPSNVVVRVFAGADNTFEMYEDDGISMNYENGAYAITKFQLKHSDNPIFIIHKPEGNTGIISEERKYIIEFNGYTLCDNISVTEAGRNRQFNMSVKNGKIIVELKEVKDKVEIKFIDKVQVVSSNNFNRITELLIRCQENNDIKSEIYEMIKAGNNITEVMMACDRKNINKDIKAALAELMVSYQ